MDQTNNVKLRWSKHQTTLLSVFDALLDSEKLTDCTISAEGHHLRAHKIILSACSPYFEELFSRNYEKYPIIILHGVKFDAVKALMDFMYRGEVNVPQEELSGILKLSESLQIRGLSGSGRVDDVNVQSESGRNTPPQPPETLPSQPASVSCFTSAETDPEEIVEMCKGRSPTVLCQDSGSVEADSISQSVQKHNESINCSDSDQGASQNAFEELITPDLDSAHDPPSERQVVVTTGNSTGGPVYIPLRALKTMLSSSHITTPSSSPPPPSPPPPPQPQPQPQSPIPSQSVCSKLQNSSGETAIAKSEPVSIPEPPDTRAANFDVHQPEIVLEIKSEVLESHMDIVEDLTLDDDDDYTGYDSYRAATKGSDVDIGGLRRDREGLTSEENFRVQGFNSLYSQLSNVHSNNMNLSASPNRFRCHSCGNSYRYPQGLWRHMKFECGKEPQFQCPHCSYRCARSDHLKKHMASRRCQMQKRYALF